MPDRNVLNSPAPGYNRANIPGHCEAPNNNVSSSNACDLDAVLRALEDDRQLLSRMIQVFLNESPALLDRTRQAVASRDAVAAERAAHTLRGALANFAAGKAGAAAQRLEDSAEQGNWGSALAAHAQLEEEMPNVVSALTAFTSVEPR